jgi:Lon protease-like protein
MYELPLFPLRTVLFPAAPLRLHIFEDRYKRMINTCLEKRQPFGVVLIRRGVEALGPLAEPFPIGCSARIIQVQKLEGGRMNILANGEERFRIVSLDKASLPYLVGSVEPIPLNIEDPAVLLKEGSYLRRLVDRYLRMISETGSTPFGKEDLPEDPVPLAYYAAAFVQIPAIQKQQLLSIHDGLELLTQVHKLYRREIALLKVMLSNGNKEKGSFSLN